MLNYEELIGRTAILKDKYTLVPQGARGEILDFHVDEGVAEFFIKFDVRPYHLMSSDCDELAEGEADEQVLFLTTWQPVDTVRVL